MQRLERVDPEIARLIIAEHKRQNETLELIASENHVSIPVLKALGSVLTDKYAEGYPSMRWYCGCDTVDGVEQVAIDRAKKLFGADHANVQPHCGTSANLGVYLAAIKPGGKLMGMDLSHGGHLSHGLEINISGQFYKSASYGVEKETEQLDLDHIREQVLRERPDILVTGASAYPRKIDFEAFGDIAKEANAVLLSDIAHIAGLVVTGQHPDPVPYSDFVTTTNHKTLRGPRGGIILCKSKWAKKIDQAIFPGIQGGPMMHAIAAKAVSFHEAMQPQFKTYAAKIVSNARTMANELMDKGWRLVSGGTDNHLMLVDLRSKLPDVTGHDAAVWLATSGIICNKNAIPFDTRIPAQSSGLRFGTPAITTRGLGDEEIKIIVEWIDKILMSHGDRDVISQGSKAVAKLCEQFPVPNYNM